MPASRWSASIGHAANRPATRDICHSALTFSDASGAAGALVRRPAPAASNAARTRPTGNSMARSTTASCPRRPRSPSTARSFAWPFPDKGRGRGGAAVDSPGLDRGRQRSRVVRVKDIAEMKQAPWMKEPVSMRPGACVVANDYSASPPTTADAADVGRTEHASCSPVAASSRPPLRRGWAPSPQRGPSHPARSPSELVAECAGFPPLPRCARKCGRCGPHGRRPPPPLPRACSPLRQLQSVTPNPYDRRRWACLHPEARVVEGVPNRLA